MLFNSLLSFAISLLSMLILPLLVPELRLFYFAPFIVTCLYQYTRIAILWRATLCGVIVDLLSSGPLFGISALNYSIVSCLLYGQTKNFFEDKLSTLPLMTFFFSTLSTLITLIAAPFAGYALHLSLRWVATDLIVMGAVDALYALFAFSLPFTLLSDKITRKT